MKKIAEPADKILFTSDPHFGHEGIIPFMERPFASAAQMDETLIERWNEVVPHDGLVFLLGDIGFATSKRIVEIFKSLNGRKILIKGNHDSNYSDKVLCSIFEEIYDLLYIRIYDAYSSKYRYIVLSHYPMLDWQSSFRGSWQLFGHLHTRSRIEFDYLKSRLFSRQYDVGVDNNNFRPVSFYEVSDIISRQFTDNRFKQSNYNPVF